MLAAGHPDGGDAMNIPDRFPATGTDIAVSITRAVTRQRIGARLRFATHLDEQRLARAVRLTLDAEPVLGCRFENGVRAPYWERLPDLDSRIPFSLVQMGDAGDAIVAFQAAEVDDAGPLVEVQLLRTEACDELGVKLSHVVADGQAAKQYLYLLAETYTRLGTQASYAPKPNLTPRPSEKDVWAALSPEQQRAAKKAPSYAMPNWVIPSLGSSGEGLTYRTHLLDPARFAGIKAYGAERDATVNEMMLTAFFRACVVAFDPPSGKALSLMSTADHRRFLPSAEHLPIASLSISGSLSCERIDGESFDATLARVRASMAAWAATSYGAAAALNAEKLARLGYKTAKAIMGMSFRMGGSGKTYPWFTNIGVIDDTRLRFDDGAPEGAYLFGPVAKGASVVPVISTYRNELAVCMGWCRKDFDSAIIGQVLELLDRELPDRKEA
jgi:NRPS condensation-like uncharacterized protein